MSSPPDEAGLEELRRDLRAIGRLPRICAVFYFGLTCAVVWASGFEHFGVVIPGLIVAAAAVMLVVTFRVRAWATRDELVIRSYWRTRTFRFSDLDYFCGVEYTGAWALWRVTHEAVVMQLDLYFRSGMRRQGASLPVTLSTPRRIRRMEERLNELVDLARPESEE